ncbi:MAG: methyltransferase domain-containing protein [Candidatus Hydrogenedentes bacterium]|nr:methyltransferase domain-containing protein [Candidatus Hydrogenedentota bacterium]
MAVPRVLTFNFHEPYLALMAKTGLPFTVGLYRKPDLARKWHTHYRPVPSNMTLVDEPVWREDVAAGRFDVVIAHNESNALDLLPYRRTPMMLVCHNRKTFLKSTMTADPQTGAETYERLLLRLEEQFQFVFISESKMADYGIGGIVIRPGIDVEEYGGYTGETPEVLRVGNMMRSRNLMFDVDLQEQVCAGIPNRVTGVDPQMPGAREAKSFHDLLGQYRSLRCLLHITRQEYEDGYNLSTLEAMATGMPVVALANATSPLTDGVNGFVAADAPGLRERVCRLLDDAGLAKDIGQKGRDTVARVFSIEAFVKNWREAIEKAADTRPGRPGVSKKVDSYYTNARPEIAQFVPYGVERVLDIGCGGGEFGRLLKEHGVREVHGIEIVPEARNLAADHLDSATLGNIEEMDLPFDDGYFDCITFADVLEHLRDPVMALRKSAGVLAWDGVIVMSIPNVRFYEVIAMLAGGRWTYADAGILDRTHLRFFTAAEMQNLVEAAGLELLRISPLSFVDEKRLPRDAGGAIRMGRVTIEPLNDADAADLRTYQYLVVAGHPGADRLERARLALEMGENEAALRMAEQAYGVDEFERTVLMARAAGRLHEAETAQRLYVKALSLRPDDRAVSTELGILLVAMNRYDEAAPRLEKALTDDPANDLAAGGLGLIYMARGKNDAAFKLLHGACGAGLDNVALLSPLYEVAGRLGRRGEIVEVMRRYADFYPANADISCELAEILVHLGKTVEAAQQLESLLFLVPSNDRARDLLASIRGDAP